MIGQLPCWRESWIIKLLSLRALFQSELQHGEGATELLSLVFVVRGERRVASEYKANLTCYSCTDRDYPPAPAARVYVAEFSIEIASSSKVLQLLFVIFLPPLFDLRV